MRVDTACGGAQPGKLWPSACAGGRGPGPQTTRLTKTFWAGRIKCDCPGRPGRCEGLDPVGTGRAPRAVGLIRANPGGIVWNPGTEVQDANPF